jgi:hypothetical protein
LSLAAIAIMTATSPAQVRAHLIEALQLDLIGPSPADVIHAEEILDQPPSKWYLTGFLAPADAPADQRSDDTGDDELDAASRVGAGDDETSPEKPPARKGFFPSSMGVSLLVSPHTHNLLVKVSWGDYNPIPADVQEAIEPQSTTTLRIGTWQRTAFHAPLHISLPSSSTPTETEIPHSGGLKLITSVRPVSETLVPAGTRSVSVFLVNQRRPAPDKDRDAAYIFQTQLVIQSEQPLVPRPDLRGGKGEDWDEHVADLQYRDDFEFAVGHNVSAIAHTENGICHQVATAWIPTAEVEKVIPSPIPGVELSMEAIAAAPTPAALHTMLNPLITHYSQWINQQQIPIAPPHRVDTATDLLNRANIANQRIAAGIQAMQDPQVFEAFCIANRAVATAIRQRLTHDRPDTSPESVSPPTWRPFQLAFLLMNIVGIAEPEHSDRALVDLLFFPTGGGKTEAYLGLAAFTLVLRRLRHPDVHSAGLSVLMRYTLRLLTLDQLGRAATLICALELERQNDVEKLGSHPFEIGLWVGQSATPNKMGKKGDNDPNSARARTIAFQNNPKQKPKPVPLENCPWCGREFTERSFQLLPDANEPTDFRITCASRKCKFTGDRALPILTVDESIYRRLPCFIIATVDKFASLPWVGETGALFGKVERYGRDGFYGSCQPGRGQPLQQPLPPPDLIIQDELHLISGPLGTMVGLYETAIDALAAVDRDHKKNHPKIVASTATVRRATRQIRALFGRDAVDVFPPPGPDRRDSFFAETVPITQKHARTYVGIAAQGRSLKVVLLRTYLALLGAVQKDWEAAGGHKSADNPADPYMTLLGYFNSLRELGGSRRIVEDEVNARLTQYSQRKRLNETEGLFADRKINDIPLELTSRVSTNEVADTKRRLALAFSEKEHVDVALATNMISVGLDITRLGLMVVLGQPKTAAEYIQATSRVGRDDSRPGLVITLLNAHRPRDRSHYERFQSWHTTFYRAVEATSVTPFSPRAVDRGIAAITVALARLGDARMTAPLKAIDILTHRKDLDFVADAIAQRAEKHDKELDAIESEALRQRIRNRVIDLLDTWENIASHKMLLQYQQEVGSAPPLLFDPLDPDLERQPLEARKFKAQRSLRDVELAVNLWVKNPDGFDVEEEDA